MNPRRTRIQVPFTLRSHFILVKARINGTPGRNGDDIVNLACCAPPEEFEAYAADFAKIVASVAFEK